MAIKLLDALAMNTATPASSTSVFLACPKTQYTIQASYIDASASVSALTITLQASADGRGVSDANAHWFDLVSHAFTAGEITAKMAMFGDTSEIPFRRIRVQMYSCTGGAAVDLLTVIFIEGEN